MNLSWVIRACSLAYSQLLLPSSQTTIQNYVSRKDVLEYGLVARLYLLSDKHESRMDWWLAYILSATLLVIITGTVPKLADTSCARRANPSPKIAHGVGWRWLITTKRESTIALPRSAASVTNNDSVFQWYGSKCHYCVANNRFSADVKIS